MLSSQLDPAVIEAGACEWQQRPLLGDTTRVTFECSTGATIALTYANDVHTDGAGAQLQRIYGIYAISRFLRLPYFHSPIKRIDYQGLAALESNRPSCDIECRYNRTFAIRSDVAVPEEFLVYTMVDADLALIKRLELAARKKRTFTLISIVYPYPITDQIPDLYRHVRAISPFSLKTDKVFRLAVHVRRGEQIALGSERMLPNSYYVSSALQLTAMLQKLKIPFVCELYTEVPSRPFVATPYHHGINGRIAGDVTVDPKMNRLEDFDILPNLVKFINGDPIDTLERMATADALVLSRSSYSYVAAILSRNCIVVYHPFWHSPLRDWLVSDQDGNVPDAELAARLESWERRSSAPKHQAAFA